MADKITITKLHIFQVNWIKEIWQATPDSHWEAQGPCIWTRISNAPVHNLSGKMLLVMTCHEIEMILITWSRIGPKISEAQPWDDDDDDDAKDERSSEWVWMQVKLYITRKENNKKNGGDNRMEALCAWKPRSSWFVALDNLCVWKCFFSCKQICVWWGFMWLPCSLNLCTLNELHLMGTTIIFQINPNHHMCT